VRLELGGEAFQRWSFSISNEFGSQGTSNTNGRTEQSAAPAGTDPTAATARYAPVQAVSPSANVWEAWINYSVCPCLNFMFGQYAARFWMRNSGGEKATTFIERNMPITSFVFPTVKETGLTAWGEIGEGKMLTYAVGMFGGDGQNRAQIDNRFDWMGRIFV